MLSRTGSRVGAKRQLALVPALTLGLLLLTFVPALLSSEPELKLPADRIYRSGDSPGRVVFSHVTHVELTDRNCLTCHPRPFSILGNRARLTHDEMNDGRLCGRCHDSRNASGVTDPDACEVCHRTSEVGSQ